MGLHLVILSKLSLMANSHSSISTPMVATLLWPLLVKLFLTLRPINQIYNDIIHNSRLFFFRLEQIAFSSGSGSGSGSRLERALRLVSERLTQIRESSSSSSQSHEESFHTLSMLAL
ncbi:hypothetical protein LguiB_034525 [Lonicera macranthoides]